MTSQTASGPSGTVLTDSNTIGIYISVVSQTPRLTRAERQAQTRDELLAAGDRLFRESGFHGTSLDQVAASAGYTKGAVYSNFASKEELFFAIYERRVEAAVARNAEALEGAPAEAPLELARELLSGSDPGWMAAFFEFWAHALRNPELRARFLVLHRRAQEPLVAHARRWLPPDRDAEGWTLANAAMVNGMQLEQLTDPRLDGTDLTVAMLDASMRGAR
jgi:AcrR family transcriptional regulator